MRMCMRMRWHAPVQDAADRQGDARAHGEPLSRMPGGGTHIQERERLGEALAIGNLHQLDTVQRRKVANSDPDLSRAVVREDDDVVRAIRACARGSARCPRPCTSGRTRGWATRAAAKCVPRHFLRAHGEGSRCAAGHRESQASVASTTGTRTSQRRLLRLRLRLLPLVRTALVMTALPPLPPPPPPYGATAAAGRRAPPRSHPTAAIACRPTPDSAWPDSARRSQHLRPLGAAGYPPSPQRRFRYRRRRCHHSHGRRVLRWTRAAAAVACRCHRRRQQPHGAVTAKEPQPASANAAPGAAAATP